MIYADVDVAMVKSSTFPTILDDDQVEYTKLNHNVHKNFMASSPEQEEATSGKSSSTDKFFCIMIIITCTDYTTPCNLDNLLIQLRPEVTPHWYQLGTIIGIDKHTLDEYSKCSPEQCLIEVLDYWLRNHYNSRPTWRDVACVLEIIQLNKLAQNILKVYETGIPISLLL